ncbi:MAG: hypothetical protein KJ043_03565 [Anaerolineae bacterium]|nr:hypothetical protein [Anaerolineae bacterium]
MMKFFIRRYPDKIKFEGYVRAQYIAPLQVIVLAFVIFFTIPLIAQPTDDPIARNRALGRTHQSLFHIQAQAQQTGWTDELNQLAGDIYYQMNDIPRAVVYWERANMTDSARLRLLADGYLQLNQWDGMANTLERLLSISPDDEWVLWHLGALLAPTNPMRARELLTPISESEDYGVAVQTILQVVDAPFDRALQVGLILGNFDQWLLAEYAFRQAVVALPEGGVGWAYVGLARHMQGKPAQTWFDQAVQLDPKNHQIYYVYSIYLRGVGDLNASRQAIITAISFNPNNPAYYIELGMVYYALENDEQGDYWLEFAQSVGRESETIRDIINQIYQDQQGEIFDFDALQAMLEATPEITPELTPEVTPETTATPSSP